ncbi:thymidine phosphorylase [archaeon]|nr:thymidine phosphorylase [archaeon]
MKVKRVDLETEGVKVVVLNKKDAADMDLDALDRIILERENGTSATAIVNLTERFIKKGEIGLFKETYSTLGAKDKEKIELVPSKKPESIRYIKDKLNGQTLTAKQINAIITDLMEEELTDVELTAWVTATYIRGMHRQEVVALTEAIVGSGPTLSIAASRIYDKHCIGGVAGNKTTMLIVPIIAAAGLKIPKTSSRAITSPAGTADCMEVIAPVAMKKDEIERVVNRVNGCIVWGGAVNLASADDKLIKVRNPLRLDPQGMLLASILAKKKAVGATDIIIDIPIGKGAKVNTKKEAESLAREFNLIGSNMKLNVHSLITDGDHPIGMAIGPSVEAREILRILAGEQVSPELKEKACQLAGVLLEISGKAKDGKGTKLAHSLINGGKANKKFREIIEAQGGNPKIKDTDVTMGKYTHTVKSEEKGKIEHINNRKFLQ